MNDIKQRGFSLIELFLTLSIISIVSVFALPNFGKVTEIQYLKSAVRDLQSSLNLTRSLAIRRAETITICVKANSRIPQCVAPGVANGVWTGGWLIFSDQNNNRQYDNNEQLLGTHSPFRLISIKSSAQKSLLRINSLGASILSNQTWKFCLAQKKGYGGFSLILSSPGQVRPVKIDSC